MREDLSGHWEEREGLPPVMHLLLLVCLEEGRTSSSKTVDMPDQGMLVEETTGVYGYESVSHMVSLLFLICPSHGRRNLYMQRSERNVSA